MKTKSYKELTRLKEELEAIRLIFQNQGLKEAANKLQSFLSEHDLAEHQNEVSLILSNVQSLKTEYIQNHIKYETYALRKNRIGRRFLHELSAIESYFSTHPSKADKFNEIKSKSRNKVKKTILFFILFLICSLLSLYFFFPPSYFSYPEVAIDSITGLERKNLTLIFKVLAIIFLLITGYFFITRRKLIKEKLPLLPPAKKSLGLPPLSPPMESALNHYSTKIKEVWLELEGYQFCHSPYSKDINIPQLFLGRETALKRLTMLLKESSSQSGAYLITGFRGVGKTSLVRKAIATYNTWAEKSLMGKPKNWPVRLIRFIQRMLIPVNLIALTGLILFSCIPENRFVSGSIFSFAWLFFLIGSFAIFYFFLNPIIIALSERISISESNTENLCLNKIEINLSQDEIEEKGILKRITQELCAYWREKLNEKDFHCLSQPYFSPAWWFYGLFTARGKKDYPTYREIADELTLLEKRLSAEISALETTGLNPSFATRMGAGMGKVVLPAFNYSRKSQAVFPVASDKEVEDSLIRIFKKISKFREKHPSIPQFLFVIDELDKIEPNSSTTITDRESSDPSFDADTSIRGGNKVRQRQETIAQVLANLKGFLNVVRAKFIFIGGREMYDASLADIADRDSFYSSIFNDVIYVNSFFKDKVRKRAGITQMTEAYLCRLFQPSGTQQQTEGWILKDLANALAPKPGTNAGCELIFETRDPSSESNSPVEEWTTTMARSKVVTLLQNYIIYLTYRSNGTPKKLISLIEDKIRPGSQLQRGDHIVVEQKNRTNHPIEDRLFLRFKFDFQYEIGLTANLYRPFIINNSRHLKALGDKLLFSSAFILDHILKFHPFGFSWRNLELIPEVILINKEPNLRRFIEQLIRFLSKQYIRPTVSGIFQYKFYSKTAIELALVSKISDLGAAAFNFTLDESLQIKRYYKRKLAELQEKYRKTRPPGEASEFIHSIGFIQTILGDLHYYDKEYDDALIYYTESIQYLRIKEKPKKLTKHQFILWLRNKLKAGLTLEKMRAFDSAFSYYRTLIMDTHNYLEEIKEHDAASWAYRSLRLLTKAHIAWLATIEKQRFDGITYFNLLEREMDIKKLLNIYSNNTDDQRQHLLLGDYYNNVGSLLYYKNKPFEERTISNVGLKIKKFPDCLHLAFESLMANKKLSSRSAFQYYYQALQVMLVSYSYRKSENEANTPTAFHRALDLLQVENEHLLNAEKSYYLANLISKAGDAILASCLSQTHTEVFNLIQKLEPGESKQDPICILSREDLYKKITDQLNNSPSVVLSPATAFCLFLLASAYYRKAGRSYSAAFQLKKILFTLRDICSALKPENKLQSDFFDNTMDRCEQLAVEIFRLLSSTSEVSNRPQILKYQNVLIDLSKPDEVEAAKDHLRTLIYNHLSNSSDTREVVLIVEEIRLRLFKYQNRKGKILERSIIQALRLDNAFISPYSQINNRFLRLLELKYRCEVLYFYLTKAFALGTEMFEPAKTNATEGKDGANESQEETKSLREKLEAAANWRKLPGDQEDLPAVQSALLEELIPTDHLPQLQGKELLRFLVKEGLFCTREIIRTIKLFETGYIVSFSFLADNHRRMAGWCHAYKHLNHFLEEHYKETQKTFQKEIENVMGNNALPYLEPNYHRELAIQNFEKAIEMHSEGRTYKAYVLNTYMLEDEFNDNLSHFCAALERYRINNGSIPEKKKKLSEALKNSHLYRYDSYFPVSWEEE